MKSLEERVADRAKRKEEAAKNAKASGDAAPSDEDTDYSKWTVAELKEELDKRGIEYASGAVKADLVAALEGA